MRTYSLNHSALYRLRELRELHGVEPTVDELIALHETGRAVLSASESENEILLDLPIRCGSVTLYAPTLAVLLWWTEKGDVWFPASHPYADLVMGYLLANGRTTGIVEGLSGYDTALKTVRAWAKTLGCTRDELGAATERILKPLQSGVEPSPTEERQTADFGRFAERVMDALGGDIWAWVWKHPFDSAVMLLRKHDTQSQANGNAQMDPHSPLCRAVAEQQRVFRQILIAHGKLESNG